MAVEKVVYPPQKPMVAACEPVSADGAGEGRACEESQQQ